MRRSAHHDFLISRGWVLTETWERPKGSHYGYGWVHPSRPWQVLLNGPQAFAVERSRARRAFEEE